MEMVRRATTAANLDRALDAERGRTLLWRCTDGDTAVAAAGQRPDRRARPLGVWLEVGPGYPAAIAARDVKTLAALVRLEHVVIGAADAARDHAAVVTALLGEGPVTFANEVADLRGAYNRPTPTGVRVWWFEGGTLTSGADALAEGRLEVDEMGERTTFA